VSTRRLERKAPASTCNVRGTPSVSRRAVSSRASLDGVMVGPGRRLGARGGSVEPADLRQRLMTRAMNGSMSVDSPVHSEAALTCKV